MTYNSDSIENLEDHRKRIVNNLNNLKKDRRHRDEEDFRGYFKISGYDGRKTYFPDEYRRLTNTRPPITYSENPDREPFCSKPRPYMYQQSNETVYRQSLKPQMPYYRHHSQYNAIAHLREAIAYKQRTPKVYKPRRPPKRFMCPDGPQTPPLEYLKSGSSSDCSFRDGRSQTVSPRQNNARRVRLPEKNYLAKIKFNLASSPQKCQILKSIRSISGTEHSNKKQKVSTSSPLDPDSTIVSQQQIPEDLTNNINITSSRTPSILLSPASPCLTVFGSGWSASTISTHSSGQDRLNHDFRRTSLVSPMKSRKVKNPKMKEHRRAKRFSREIRKMSLRQEIQRFIDAGVKIYKKDKRIPPPPPGEPLKTLPQPTLKAFPKIIMQQFPVSFVSSNPLN